MEYDPRAPFGHQHGGPRAQPPPPPFPPAPPPRPLTFGGVFWACFLALMTWSILVWLVVGALLEQTTNDF